MHCLPWWFLFVRSWSDKLHCRCDWRLFARHVQRHCRCDVGRRCAMSALSKWNILIEFRRDFVQWRHHLCDWYVRHCGAEFGQFVHPRSVGNFRQHDWGDVLLWHSVRSRQRGPSWPVYCGGSHLCALCAWPLHGDGGPRADLLRDFMRGRYVCSTRRQCGSHVLPMRCGQLHVEHGPKLLLALRRRPLPAVTWANELSPVRCGKLFASRRARRQCGLLTL